MTVVVEYLPSCETLEQATDWAAARGLVAVCYWGEDGMVRGYAVPPEAAAWMAERRAQKLAAVAEGWRP